MIFRARIFLICVFEGYNLSCSFIFINKSSLLQVNFTTNGTITGTKAMYEYAAIAMEPNNSGANFKVVKIDVGPSAPPMVANDAACFMVNIPDAAAISRIAKIPN